MSIESYQSSQYTYHLTFGWKHIISSISLVLRAAANPFYPDSSQLLLVLSLPSKAPLLYLHHIIFFGFFCLDIFMVEGLTRIRRLNERRSIHSLVRDLLLFATSP